MGGQSTRDQIIQCADRLFYENGFEHTSFTDIAAAVQISRGNFYYHFKTKDEILDAVILHRLATTQAMLERWEAEGGTPVGRIGRFIHILIQNQAKIMKHGCPVGTLCHELAKLNHAAQADATRLFTLFRDWLARQFTLLGRAADADALALHLLARSQGVATLAQALRDEGFVQAEVRRMDDWLAALAPEPPGSAQPQASN
ncbi:TetR/AcrR family transcriptional regulator [Nitrospirillum iridis]|uniref:AcrR family transcriptional regulator n=1 Tax=Nitrospirillum iridis TaxID=765888 RepID=A0A7X0AV72_9PROT|nr:TetR/AcrR family transcriptional regulator [Nitrospirillum iridis]MBB6250670.1 AcrR family transcriptional regulator [Nitrospirillum iridis]